MKKQRLDAYLLGHALVKDQREAFIIVTEGRVFVNGQKAVSPALFVNEDDHVEIKAEQEFVGRGAYKLQAAIEAFHISVQDKVCADIGSATGGFVQILLNYGAKKVYALDTAVGKLDLVLRDDSRVVVMEGVDVRKVAALPEKIELVTIDVSLIPLREILPHVKRLIGAEGDVIALLKPQYEARDKTMLTHGVIKGDGDRKKIVDDFTLQLNASGYQVKEMIESPIRGSKGNVEYLLYLKLSYRT